MFETVDEHQIFYSNINTNLGVQYYKQIQMAMFTIYRFKYSSLYIQGL